MSIRSELKNTSKYLRSLRNSIIERGGDLSDTAGLKDLVEAVKTITPTIGLEYSKNTDVSGSDEFIYYACNGIGSSTDNDITIASKVNGLPVAKIADSAFVDETALTSVIMPNSITLIMSSAFARCTFTHIEIPSSVQTIEVDAFNGCRSLRSVKLNAGLKILGGFANCERLGNIIIPDGVKTISTKAFLQCYYNLTDVTIPATVTQIEDRAFQRCTNLTTVTIGRSWSLFSATSLGTKVFDGCTKLTEIRVPNTSLRNYKTATNWSEYADLMVGY